jgi:hypothetical protein
MRDSSSNTTKTPPGSTVAAFTVRPTITFVSFWFLAILYCPVPPAGEYPQFQGFQLRHELALLGFSIEA